MTSFVRGADSSSGVRGLSISVNNVLMELRTICNHPVIRLVGHDCHCPGELDVLVGRL